MVRQGARRFRRVEGVRDPWLGPWTPRNDKSGGENGRKLTASSGWARRTAEWIMARVPATPMCSLSHRRGGKSHFLSYQTHPREQAEKHL